MTSRPPLLSIYIPLFNHAEFLRDNLDSIIHQIREGNFQDSIEIAISNNCSTDDSDEILQEYISLCKDIQFYYTKNSSNIGGLGNIMGFHEKTTGDYIHMIGDDSYAPGAIRNVIGLLSKNPSLDFLLLKTNSYSDYEYIENASNESFFRNVEKIGYIGNFILKRSCFKPDPETNYTNNFYPHMILIFENIIHAKKCIDTRFTCINGRRSWNYNKSIKKLFILLRDSLELGIRTKNSIGEEFYNIYIDEVCKWVKQHLYRLRYHRDRFKLAKMMFSEIPSSKRNLKFRIFFYGTPCLVFFLYSILYQISISFRDISREIRFKRKQPKFEEEIVTDKLIGNA
jgi:glycosyltransferase involved in cell wall biosynthesis